MSWSDRLMGALDERATMVYTTRGDVQVAREGQGPPVLVVHGGQGFDIGLAWCRNLLDGGCEVLAPSRPGYLRTPLESGRTPQDQADLYAAMLDTLDIERVAVLGFSSGGPAAVHFAARHPDRTTALFLDTAILLPFEPPISALRRAALKSRFVVWLTYQVGMRWPAVMTRFVVGGVSDGLNKEQKKTEVDWITSDPARLRNLQEQSASIAPMQHRKLGWTNDQTNERNLAPLPFADVTAPTLIALGTNDAIIPREHATNAAANIAGAELILVEEGHHMLSLSRNYGQVAERQLELRHG
jgi:pimeloyl-ACP methyl ester carboxylesterase